MTYLFDRQRGMETLAALEGQWGGTLAERTARQAAEYARIAEANKAVADAAKAAKAVEAPQTEGGAE